MASETALQRRIKRRVIGPKHNFFIVTTPGLEKACCAELQQLDSALQEVTVSRGGVAFSGKLHTCYEANLHLRTATRVLMRIGSISARHFSRFEREIGELPWELYLPPGAMPRVEVSIRQCRLYHSGAISERARTGIDRHWGKAGQKPPQPLPSEAVPRLFIRGRGDRFTISLDSSGDQLHKRGLKPQVGAAPIRETTAAAALQYAGYTGKQVFVDPMSGSGTFSLEAAMISLNTPPGWYREFAFFRWPAFSRRRWHHIRAQAAKGLLTEPKALILSADSDPQCYANLQHTFAARGLDRVIKVIHKDFLKISSSDLAKIYSLNRPGILALNPPYGYRLGHRTSSRTFFQALGRHLARNFKGWRAIMVCPSSRWISLLPFKTKRYPVFHGGLQVQLLIGTAKG